MDRCAIKWRERESKKEKLNSFLFELYVQVYTWGCNDEGALGRETKEGDEYVPGRVEKLGKVKVVQVSGGDSHTVALASNGNVYCWGVFRVSANLIVQCHTIDGFYSCNIIGFKWSFWLGKTWCSFTPTRASILLFLKQSGQGGLWQRPCGDPD